MKHKSFYVVALLFGFYSSVLTKQETISKNYHEKLRLLLNNAVPMTESGKIRIPDHLKHVKLDIGLSYAAHYSQYWLSHEEDLVVFGFEPNPAAISSVLDGPIRYSNGLQTKYVGKSFFLIPCALGLSEDTKIKFYVTKKDEGCSSIYYPNYLEVARIIEVPIFRLSDFFDLFPFDTHPIIDYIKIDAQGADLDIVKSTGNYLKERVVYITIEAGNYHYKDAVNTEDDIDNYMKSQGFIRHRSSDTLDPTYFNPLYADYVKNNKVTIYQK